MTGYIGSCIDITERKRLEKEVLEISEREQSRIGQDLHDGLCQHLAGIEFQLLGLKQKLASKSNQHAAQITELAKLVRGTVLAGVHEHRPPPSSTRNWLTVSWLSRVTVEIR